MIGTLAYTPKDAVTDRRPLRAYRPHPASGRLRYLRRTTFSNVLVGPETQGERIRIEGRIFDGLGLAGAATSWSRSGRPMRRDATIIPPTDRRTSRSIPSFRGWGRTGTNFETGLYMFETIKPGRVIGRRGRELMAPHVNVWLVARGINIGLSTRMYFADETDG